MISDEKRREVAENLRYLIIRPYLRYKEQAFDEIADTVLEPWDYHDINAVIEKLADLIDRPTCRNVSGHRDEFECSECRCKVESLTEVCNERGEIFRVPFMPKYCPNCDAEVVDDD